MARAVEDPHLGPGPDEEDGSSSGWDSDSILSDDSVLPDYSRETWDGRTASTLYQACARNNLAALQRVLERGVTRDEVMELDINNWNGLMVACCKGFLDIVYALNTCPHVDINHQDHEGNTALMIASQAGADIGATDTTRGKCAQDWAQKTGRYETLYRLRRLTMRPKAEQFCESYVPEWPELRQRVAKATAERSAREKISQHIKTKFAFRFPRDPEDEGVLDHMVRITTSLHSPLISTGCRPLCPTSPPEAGKRRLAVPELMRKHSERELEESSVCHSDGSASHAIPSVQSAESIATTCCADADRRGSIISLASNKVASRFIPRSMARRNSVFPSGCIPHININRPTEATPKKEKKKKKVDKDHLEPPKWRYKEIKEEKKKKAEQEKKKDGKK
ncbi:ankyrin repeat domain-containing protein 33B isoform X2 [Entelurus aequoreus]|uniref:ankyrin repeat domain-containing protein 33B isoform X2 n=1 Tax=Entelurus aequoreus TaxID=161455 RepID=UPI002B1D621A|nr:ankyrin repeat domain-containing protein 33B isoform X2 [Entelurus aequoreus]